MRNNLGFMLFLAVAASFSNIEVGSITAPIVQSLALAGDWIASQPSPLLR